MKNLKVLIAEDEPVTREKLAELLRGWGCDVTAVRDGNEAWQILQQPAAPELVLADVQMPGMDGPELCRLARADFEKRGLYVILLTSVRVTKADQVDGLLAGADDYLLKPYDQAELHARLKVGQRVLKLQADLSARVKELEDALGQVQQLQGLLPICAYCKKVRDDKNYWHQVENYIARHSAVTFTHGICPQCYETQMFELKKRGLLDPK
jgi:phosphoserine phosphatase RsbU/P